MSPFAGARPVVLVVEDEPLLRLLAMELIEDGGFDVVPAGDVSEAVAILEQRVDIRIVFTDIDMPGGMDGMRLAAMIRERWPPIDIVVTSSHIHVKQSDLPERGVFMAKPYDSHELVSMLREIAGSRTDLPDPI